MLPQKPPNIWWAVLAGVLGGVTTIIFQAAGGESTPGGLGAGLIAFVFFVAALVQVLDVFLWVVAHRLDELMTARAITPEWMLATAMQDMTPDQLAAYTIRPVDKETMAMITGPTETFSLHIDQPLEVMGLHTMLASTVREFFRKSDPTRLCPIRYFSDGPRREDARLLTYWCVDKGLASWAKGNQAALWVGKGYDGALKAFGLTKEDLAKSDEWDDYRDLQPIPAFVHRRESDTEEETA